MKSFIPENKRKHERGGEKCKRNVKRASRSEGEARNENNVVHAQRSLIRPLSAL